tara:strand:+ start:168 stop:290 length:123 start_codon:yes stop_codon:yes gene_type:complete
LGVAIINCCTEVDIGQSDFPYLTKNLELISTSIIALQAPD